MIMKIQLNLRWKQIISWPLFIAGIYLINHGVIYRPSDLITFFGVLIIVPGFFLRTDVLDKDNMKEIEMKLKTYFAVGAILFLLSSVSHLIYVLFNLENINIENQEVYVSLGMLTILLYFGLPCEIYLYRKYKRHITTVCSRAQGPCAR